MAITVVSEPALISFSLTPVAFKLQTDNFVTSSGSKAVNDFLINSLPADGDTFPLVWGDESETMTCATSPDDSGNQFPATSGSPTIANYINTIIPYFQENYKINRDFTISRDGDKIVFTAREKGNDFVMDDSDTGDMDGSWTVPFGIIDTQTRDNFFIGINVYVDDDGSGDYVRIRKELHKPDITNQQVIFDISRYLHAYLEEHEPGFNQATFSKTPEINKQYYIEYFEVYGTTPDYQKLYTSGTKRVIKGGLKAEDYPDYTNIYSDYLTTEKAFLTIRPDERYVSPSTQNFLYWLSTELKTSGPPVVPFSLNALVYYTDGTTDTSVILTEDTQGKYETGLFPAGFEQCGLDSLQPSKTPYKYEIWIENDADSAVLSKKITFHLEEEGYLDRQFMYETSMGTFEVIRTTGRHEQGVDVEKDEIRIPLAHDHAATDREIKSYNVGFRNVRKGSTGHVSAEEVLALIEFVRSEKVYELRNGKKFPVTIPGGEYSLKRDDDGLFFINFEYYGSYERKSWSNLT